MGCLVGDGSSGRNILVGVNHHEDISILEFQSLRIGHLT